MNRTSVVFAFRNRRRTGDFAEDRVEVGGALGEVGVDGSEFATVDDELGTEVDERLGIGGGARR